jgi:hypothetical protein
MISALTKTNKPPEPEQQSAYVDRGTNETRKKLKRTTMQRLVEKNRLTGYEVAAAQEIERVFVNMWRHLFPRTGRYSERTDKVHSDWSDNLVSAYHARYAPWYDRMMGRGNRDAYDIMIEILVYGTGGKAIDKIREWGNGTSVHILVCGLRDYALSAGWVDSRTERDWEEDKRIPERIRKLWIGNR